MYQSLCAVTCDIYAILASYDTFFAKHIVSYGNAGRGKESYLSSITVEEFINFIAQRVQDTIVNEIKQQSISHLVMMRLQT